MSNTKVMILEGTSGLSFFLQETLLDEGLADQVELVNQASQAIDLINQSGPYSLVVIDLIEAWEQGMQLGFWLSQRPPSCPVILIVPPEPAQPLASNTSFITLTGPMSLKKFTSSIRTILSSSNHGNQLSEATQNEITEPTSR